jgi:hypothetical protein
MTCWGPLSGKEACRYRPERAVRSGGGREAKGPTEGGNQGSGERKGGSHFLQELSGHQTGPENLAGVIGSRGFQAERERGVKRLSAVPVLVRKLAVSDFRAEQTLPANLSGQTVEVPPNRDSETSRASRASIAGAGRKFALPEFGRPVHHGRVGLRVARW